jgi:hypothetical protein
MASKKRDFNSLKKKEEHSDRRSTPPSEQLPAAMEPIAHYLEIIAAKRLGGAINFRGISYQLLYASCQLLEMGVENSQLASVHLEGLEDIDLRGSDTIENTEYVQIKTSQNSLDASRLWSLNVLQNFLEVHEVNPKARFRLVYNMPISGGHLQHLIQQAFNPSMLAYWKSKLISAQKKTIPLDIPAFLARLTFEYITQSTLYTNLLTKLLTDYDINSGTEEQFVKALFYHAFTWSQERTIVRPSDVHRVLQEVKDTFSKASINEAVRHRWIASVSFENSDLLPADDTSYFEGMAAQPFHIARHLPVRRPEWEENVQTRLADDDVVLIKASSGQGKSTLAWQVAYTLLAQGRQIYQVTFCRSSEEANSIREFLEARVRIGELPVVIIDGLSGRVREWGQLVEQLKLLPIKFLVTSREEDWYHYGADPSVVRLQTVNLSLSASEAASIFQQFRSKNQLSPHVAAWQPAWEAVAGRGLLIEYVYLLTRGELLRDRLATQIRTIELNRDDRDAAAKLELLRLITAADCLNLRLDTAPLVRHIQSTIGFSSDRGEVIRQLEHEYLLSFSSRQVEGLHPVRSQHLLELLHTNLPLAESLLNIFSLIKNTEVYDFFLAADALLPIDESQEFYQQIATQVATRSFPEIVGALDGLLHVGAQRYWLDNRIIFDAAFARGGIELFVYDTLPFTKVNLLRNLNSTAGQHFNNIGYLIARLEELTPFSLNDSNLMLFARELHQYLTQQPPRAAYDEVGLLASWFAQLSLSIPALVVTDATYLLHELASQPLARVSELFLFFSLAEPVQHQAFLHTHVASIISQLKIKTDTPTIDIIDNELHLTYLLPPNTGEANNLSVSRLEAAHALLPFFKRYCSAAVVFPYPNSDLYEYTLQSAVKHMPPENLANSYSQRVNQIWAATILDNYRATSSFHWQEAHFNLRTQAVAFARLANRLLEAKLEQNTARYSSTVRALNPQADLLDPILRQRPTLPRPSRRYLAKPVHEEQERTIKDWESSLRNFVHQFIGLLENKEYRLPMMNLKTANYKLTAMQEASQFIAAATHPYFALASLEIDEQKTYGQLFETVSFYAQRVASDNSTAVHNVRAQVREGADKVRPVKLNRLTQIIREYEATTTLLFHLPTHLVETDLLTYAAVGIEGFDFTDQEALEHLWMGLARLGSLDITFFTFFVVEDGTARIGFRFSEHFFQQIAQFMGDESADVGELTKPHLVFATQELLSSLPTVQLRGVDETLPASPLVLLAQQLWQLTEYRQRLSSQVPAEMALLRLREAASKQAIAVHLRELATTVSNTTHSRYTAYVTQVMSGEYSLEALELVDFVNKELILFPQ